MNIKNTFILSLFLVLPFTQSLHADFHGSPGKDKITPISVNLYDLPQVVHTDIIQDMPKTFAPHYEEIERMKNQMLPVYNPSDPTAIKVNSGNGDNLSGIFIWNSGQGPTQNGLVPADVDIGYGAGKTIIVTNQQFNIYTSQGVQNYTNTFSNFFAPIGVQSLMFDPKVFYDVWNSKWVMLCMGVNQPQNTLSFAYIAISQTSDANGSWWLYRFDMRLNGGTNTNNWADLGHIGYSYPAGGTGNVGCIALGVNQYDITTGNFAYSKLRLFKTAELFIGAGASWYDYWNLQDADATTSFTPSPARQPWSTGTGGTIYLINTRNNGGNVINIRHVDNPASTTPTLSAPSTISVTAYTVPPNAPSLGGTGTLASNDCRTQDCYFMNNQIYTAWNSTINWGSGNNAVVQYLRANVSTNTASREARYGNNGTWFFHGSACPEYKSPFTNGYAGLSFSVSSATMYPSYAVLTDDGASNSPYYSVAGSGYLGGGVQRFGDYSGITFDDTQNGLFHSSGMLAHAGSWGTGTFQFSFSPAPTGISGNNGEIPSSYSLEQNYPNPFNPATKIAYGLPKAGNVKISVHDILGREVSLLVDKYQAAGNYEINFDATNIPSGVYFYTITANGFTQSKKMILNK